MARVARAGKTGDDTRHLTLAAERAARTDELLQRAKASLARGASGPAGGIPAPHDDDTSFSAGTGERKKRASSAADADVLQLQYAASQNDTRALKTVLATRVAVNGRDERGRTALMLACMADASDCVRLLVDHRAMVNARDAEGQTALHVACRYNAFRCVQCLVQQTGAAEPKRVPDCNLQDAQGRTPLHWAVHAEAVDACAVLLRNCQDLRLEEQDTLGMTPLHLAAARELDTFVTMLLRSGASPLVQDAEGLSPLHHTVPSMSVACVRALVEHDPAVLEVRDALGRTALTLAAAEGNTALVVLLLTQRATDVDAVDTMGRTALCWAVVCLQTRCVELLVQHKEPRAPSTAVCDQDGATPAHYAMQYNALDELALLLDAGADVTATDNKNRTLVIWAAMHDSTEACKVVLEHGGVDVSAADDEGSTALHYAALGGSPSLCKLLLEHGAEVDVLDGSQHTALFHAVSQGHDHVVRVLLPAGASMLRTNAEGQTVLHRACGLGNVDCVRALLSSPDVFLEVTDDKGMRPLHNAAYGGHVDVIQALISARADLNASDNKGVRPLHWATVDGHAECCEALVSGGAHINARETSNTGHTPLDYAIMFRHMGCAQVLADLGALTHDELREQAAGVLQAAWRHHRASRAASGRAGSAPVTKSSANGLPTAISRARVRHFLVNSLHRWKQMYAEANLPPEAHTVARMAVVAGRSPPLSQRRSTAKGPAGQAPRTASAGSGHDDGSSDMDDDDVDDDDVDSRSDGVAAAPAVGSRSGLPSASSTASVSSSSPCGRGKRSRRAPHQSSLLLSDTQTMGTRGGTGAGRRQSSPSSGSSGSRRGGGWNSRTVVEQDLLSRKPQPVEVTRRSTNHDIGMQGLTNPLLLDRGGPLASTKGGGTARLESRLAELDTGLSKTAGEPGERGRGTHRLRQQLAAQEEQIRLLREQNALLDHVNRRQEHAISGQPRVDDDVAELKEKMQAIVNIQRRCTAIRSTLEQSKAASKSANREGDQQQHDGGGGGAASSRALSPHEKAMRKAVCKQLRKALADVASLRTETGQLRETLADEQR
eukprot:m.16429 g.16429  ORF g.16429 m.16429 type:complete len:1060 (+) comp5253_c0_seq1:208-3387(+)